MNPLSPFTYYRRHKWSALLLMSLITLTTLGLCLMAAVLDSITLMNAEINYLKYVTEVIPMPSATDPGVISQIKANPDVERVIQVNGLWIDQPTLAHAYGVSLLGVPQDDLAYLIEKFHMRIKEGRLLEPRSNEIMLSEEVTRALGLKLGDQIDRLVNPDAYAAILTPMVLVGILEADPTTLPKTEPNVRVGLASYEYFSNHELYETEFISMLVVPREGRKPAVDAFLEHEIVSPYVFTRTYRQSRELYTQDWQEILTAFGVINLLVAIGAAVVVGVVNQIAISRRLPELGMLNALGYQKKQLIRRLALETSVLSGLSWILGLVLAFVVLVWLKSGPYYAKGMELDLRSPTPLWFTIPLPLTVIFLSAIGMFRAFAKFDAVAIVERGKLTLETPERVTSPISNSGAISAFTFYLRHRRRGIVLLVSTISAILIITIPVFINIAIVDAMKPNLEYLQSVSKVWPSGDQTNDAGVLGQIRTHPSVERVVPVMATSLQIAIPLGDKVDTGVYGIMEGDLSYLIDLLGMQIKEGRLLRERSNEILISETVAVNHGLQVGNVIQLPYYIPSAHETIILIGDKAEMEIVGILAGQSKQTIDLQTSSQEIWMNFASYEFMENHESISPHTVHWLVIPKTGYKAEMDRWLEQNIASNQIQVTTYSTQFDHMKEQIREPVFVFALIEIGITVIVSIAVAILNYISFTQRREEFGVLNALGRSRGWLVLRTAKETGSIVAIAWFISAVIYGISLLGAQTAIYAPLGMKLDLLNPIPWFFMFPIPVAIILASVGTIAGVLTRLDPVATIERR